MAKEILIADGDKAGQKELKKIFEATDYNLIFSESGEQVLLRLKLFKPNLILIGASLKEKSGLEVLKAVKTDPESKHIPVILLPNILKGFSEEDRKRFRVEGIITLPLEDDKILNLVDRLIEEGEVKERGEGIIGREMEWNSIAEKEPMNSGRKEEVLLEPLEETEDEVIIDLVDVVEEPELKMSIQDFVATGKEAPLTEITPLESWEKLMEEEKPADKRSKFGPDEKEREAKGLSLKLGEEVHFRKEVSDKESLEKIALEEILQKVEQLTPDIEKEWPRDARQGIPEEKWRAPEKAAPTVEEPSGKYAGLAEFEAALRMGLGDRPSGEAQPSHLEKLTEAPKIETKEEIELETKEEPKAEAPEEVAPAEVSLEEQIEEVLKKLPQEGLEEELEEVKEEEFPELVMEELKEKGIGPIETPHDEKVEIFESLEVREVEEEEILVIEEPEEERIELFEEIEAPKAVREEARVLEKLKEEQVKIFKELEVREVEEEEILVIEEPEEERIELFEEIEAPKAVREEARVVEEPKEEQVDIFEGLEVPEIEKEEILVIEEPEKEQVEIFEGIEAPEIVKEEERGFESPREERLEVFKEVTTPRFVAPEMAIPEVKTPEVTAPILQREEGAPPARAVEQLQMEEAISKGVREMMEGFITKLVPEMTQNIINLTLERIEWMVKEIVPELAEKMIREEIERLQKGEKD